MGAAIGAGAAVAVAAARVGAGVDGAIVAAGAIVGAGVDGALVAWAGACVGVSVASSPPQATISRTKTISAPTRENIRQCLDHCILFMLRYLFKTYGRIRFQNCSRGVVIVANILKVLPNLMSTHRNGLSKTR